MLSSRSLPDNLIPKVISTKNLIHYRFYIMSNMVIQMHIYTPILRQQPLHQLESRIEHIKVRISPTSPCVLVRKPFYDRGFFGEFKSPLTPLC